MLPVVHHKVFGAYTCIAENTHGRLEKVIDEEPGISGSIWEDKDNERQ